MAYFLTSLALTTLVMSALILVLLCFFMGMHQLTTAKTRYFIWIVVIIGLVIPFRPVVGSGLLAITPPLQPTSIIEDRPVETIEPQGSFTNTIQKQEYPIPMETILFLMWAIGAAAVFLWHMGKYIKFRNLISRWGSDVSDQKVWQLLNIEKAQLGLSRTKIKLLQCEWITSPMVMGIIHPTILLPTKDTEDDELALIFKHELIHCKHGDLFVKLLGILAISIHWFNPIVYMGCYWAQTDMEAYCDEALLEGADVTHRRHYGEVIIGMIGKKETFRTVFSTGFYGGKSNIKRRLGAIMDTNKKMKKTGFCAVSFTVLLTISSGSFVAFAKTGTEPLIGLKKAKAIAVEHAGVQSSAITYVKAKLDPDGGKYEYDIEFTVGNKEYDYEIDAISGKILEHDQEIEHNKASAAPASKGLITEAKAKAIALESVGLKEADCTFIQTKLDYDDGKDIYDIEFYSGKTEYDFEIDAATGAILQQDNDVENHSIPHKNQQNKSAKTTPPSTANSYIGEPKAKSIALTHAGLTEASVTGLVVSLDHDDRKVTYDVKFRSSNIEYEYEIDASSGKILEWDKELDD